MEDGNLNDKRLGWVGAGRMGLALATRLLEAGCDVAVYNRTRSKAEPLAELGATLVERPVDLGDRDIVFTTLAGPSDFVQVLAGPEGLLSGSGPAPAVVVDSTTVSAEASAIVRAEADKRGTDEHNRGLGQRRADAVRDYMASQGIAESRITTKGWGKSKPIASNSTKEGRAKNRRVEITEE